MRTSTLQHFTPNHPQRDYTQTPAHSSLHTHTHGHTHTNIHTHRHTHTNIHTHSLTVTLFCQCVILTRLLFSTLEIDGGWQCVILTHLFSPQKRDGGWQPAEVREAWEGGWADPGCGLHPSLSHSAGDGPGPALLWHSVRAFHALGRQLCLRPDARSGEVRNWFLLPSCPVIRDTDSCTGEVKLESSPPWFLWWWWLFEWWSVNWSWTAQHSGALLRTEDLTFESDVILDVCLLSVSCSVLLSAVRQLARSRVQD